MRQLLVPLLLASVMHVSAQDPIFSEMKDSRALMQTRILPESTFNLPSMEAIARRFLGDVSAKTVVSRLSIYNRQDIAAEENGGMCEGSHLAWRGQYDRFPKEALMAADVTSIGEDAVLRIREIDGTVNRRVLRGKDPTRVSVGEVTFEILFVTGRFRSRFEGCGVAGTLEPVLFLRTDSPLSPDICQRATSSLAATLRADHLWVHFRNDHWFICSQFPVVFPFASREPLPSEIALDGSVEYSCSVSCDHAVNCLPAGRAPLKE